MNIILKKQRDNILNFYKKWLRIENKGLLSN